MACRFGSLAVKREYRWFDRGYLDDGLPFSLKFCGRRSHMHFFLILSSCVHGQDHEHDRWRVSTVMSTVGRPRACLDGATEVFLSIFVNERPWALTADRGFPHGYVRGRSRTCPWTHTVKNKHNNLARPMTSCLLLPSWQYQVGLGLRFSGRIHKSLHGPPVIDWCLFCQVSPANRKARVDWRDCRITALDTHHPIAARKRSDAKGCEVNRPWE